MLPVALGSWQLLCGQWSGLAWSCAQLGGLAESKEPKEAESRAVCEAVPVCSSGSLAGSWGCSCSMVGALPGAAALRAHPLLAATSQTATGAERQEELLRGHGHKDTASAEPQQSLLQALSLLHSHDW